MSESAKYVAWLERLSRQGGKGTVDRIDARALGRIAKEISRLRKAEAELRRLEWSGRYSYCTGWPACPSCKGIKPGYGRDEFGNPPDSQGHHENCKLNEALGGEITVKST